MGIYYQVACDDLKERIDPGSIDDLGTKAGAIAHPEHPFGAIVIFALSTRWKGESIRLVDDRGDDAGYFDYEEVTKYVLRDYNEFYNTGYQFTPMDDD